MLGRFLLLIFAMGLFMGIWRSNHPESRTANLSSRYNVAGAVAETRTAPQRVMHQTRGDALTPKTVTPKSASTNATASKSVSTTAASPSDALPRRHQSETADNAIAAEGESATLVIRLTKGAGSFTIVPTEDRQGWQIARPTGESWEVRLVPSKESREMSSSKVRTTFIIDEVEAPHRVSLSLQPVGRRPLPDVEDDPILTPEAPRRSEIPAGGPAGEELFLKKSPPANTDTADESADTSDASVMLPRATRGPATRFATASLRPVDVAPVVDRVPEPLGLHAPATPGETHTRRTLHVANHEAEPHRDRTAFGTEPKLSLLSFSTVGPLAAMVAEDETQAVAPVPIRLTLAPVASPR